MPMIYKRELSSMLACGIGERYIYLELEDFRSEQVVDFIRKYVKSLKDSTSLTNKKGIGLVLSGSTGTGKTMLASIIAKHLKLNEPYFSVFYVDAEEIISLKFNKDAKYNAVESCKLLIIDDLNKNNKPDVLENLLVKRINNSRINIICTNLGLKQFNTLVGEKVSSILLESSISLTLTDKEDYRKEIQRKIQKDLFS